jgi:hypothetical protein
MRQAGLLGVALLCCLELVVTAQVNVTDPPPKAPSYTPEQLFGSSARGSSTNSDSSSASTPAQTSPSLPRTTSQPPAPSPACAPTTNTPPNASSFPGVSASQFPRAGVSADAIERPGVSAEQLRTLIPGNGTNTCAKQRDVVLHPDPERPPRPIRSVTDEQ